MIQIEQNDPEGELMREYAQQLRTMRSTAQEAAQAGERAYDDTPPSPAAEITEDERNLRRALGAATEGETQEDAAAERALQEAENHLKRAL